MIQRSLAGVGANSICLQSPAYGQMAVAISWRSMSLEPASPPTTRPPRVNISAKTEYACLAIMELAAHYGSGKPLRIGVIAKRHGIPPRFLVQILLQLKGAGFVSSTRGASGGYQLIKDPADMALADVMSVIEGRTKMVTSSATNHTPTSRVLLSVWNDIKRAERTMLEQATIADLVERVRGETEEMYFI